MLESLACPQETLSYGIQKHTLIIIDYRFRSLITDNLTASGGMMFWQDLPQKPNRTQKTFDVHPLTFLSICCPEM